MHHPLFIKKIVIFMCKLDKNQKIMSWQPLFLRNLCWHPPVFSVWIRPCMLTVCILLLYLVSENLLNFIKCGESKHVITLGINFESLLNIYIPCRDFKILTSVSNSVIVSNTMSFYMEFWTGFLIMLIRCDQFVSRPPECA